MLTRLLLVVIMYQCRPLFWIGTILFYVAWIYCCAIHKTSILAYTKKDGGIPITRHFVELLQLGMNRVQIRFRLKGSLVLKQFSLIWNVTNAFQASLELLHFELDTHKSSCSRNDNLQQFDCVFFCLSSLSIATSQ